MLCTSYFLSGSSAAAVIPFLPVYMDEVLGMSQSQIGIVSAGAFVFTSAMTPGLCAIVDRTRAFRMGFIISTGIGLVLQGLTFFTKWVKTDLQNDYGGDVWYWVFWCWMGVAYGFLGAGFTLLDTLVLKVIDEETYGQYRLWAALGWAGSAFAMGFVYQYALGYEYMFIIFAVVMLPQLPLWAFFFPKDAIKDDEAALKEKKRKKKQKETEKKSMLLSDNDMEGEQESNTLNDQEGEANDDEPDPDLTYLQRLRIFRDSLDSKAIETMIVVVPMGSAYGMMNSFLFVFLRELGASSVLLGLSILLNVLTEVPCFVLSQTLREKYGVRGILYIGLVAYVGRCVWYSWIRNPWVVLPAELLHGVTFALVWSSLAVFAKSIVPKKAGLEATAQGLFSLLFNGLGALIGAVGGGYLYQSIGPRYLFVIMGIFNFLGLAFLLIMDAIRRVRGQVEPQAENDAQKALLNPTAAVYVDDEKGGIN